MPNAMRYLLKTLLMGLFSLFFSGCIRLSTPHSDNNLSYATPKTHQQQAKNIQQWRILGAFSINNGEKTELANYTWELKDQDNYHVTVSSSLNLYHITIINDRQQLSLQQNQKDPLIANTPEALMQQAVGYSLPISNLYYWIRGLPAPGKAKTQFDESGHLSTLAQAGWEINYRHYQSVNGIDLPSLIQLYKTPFNIKIAIKSWQLPKTDMNT